MIHVGRRSYPYMEEVNEGILRQFRCLRPSQGRVLDVGCGPGRVAIPIARKVGPDGEVLAVDIQAGMLRRAQEKARAAKLTNIRFLEAAVGEGKFPRDRFDRANQDRVRNARLARHDIHTVPHTVDQIDIGVSRGTKHHRIAFGFSTCGVRR